MGWHSSNQNKSRPNIKSDAFKKILWKEREREREDDAHYRIDFWWVFIDFYFSKKRWFNLDFSAREAKKFLLKKDKHVSACMSVLLGM